MLQTLWLEQSRDMRLPRESFRKHHSLFLRNAIQMVLLKQITHKTFMISGRYSLLKQRELWIVPLLQIAFSVDKDAVHLCIFLLIQFLSNPGQRWQKCIHIPIPSHLKNFLKGLKYVLVNCHSYCILEWNPVKAI